VRNLAWKKIPWSDEVPQLSNTAPVDVDFNVASAGVATDASRRDHKHDVPEALVGDLVADSFAGAGVGVANKFVRADHKHPITEGTLTDLKPVDGTAESLGSVDKLVRADHIHMLGALVGNVDANRKSWTKLAIENVASHDATPVQGQIDFLTTDDHIYVYVV